MSSFTVDEYGVWDEEAQKVLDDYLEQNPDMLKKFNGVLGTSEGRNLFYEIYKRTKASEEYKEAE